MSNDEMLHRWKKLVRAIIHSPWEGNFAIRITGIQTRVDKTAAQPLVHLLWEEVECKNRSSPTSSDKVPYF